MTGETGGTPGRSERPSRADEQGTSVGEYASLGIQFAASILVFLFLGQWLDRRLGTAPWMLLIGVFLGAGGSFYGMYRRLMAAQARDEAAKATRRGGKGPT
jgi:F0F1-type ATP synthase assembly protein I